MIAFNDAGYAGGIVLNWSGGKVRNNIIYHNTCSTAAGGGGVMIWLPPPNSAFLENNTIICNRSITNSGGIDNNSIDAVVENNVVWGNRQVAGGQITAPQLTNYNNIEDYSGETNISAYPHLEDNTFLSSGISPCIDAGDPAGSYNDIEDPGNSGMALPPSKGTVRNDIGSFGGLLTKILPLLDSIYDIHVSTNSLSMQCQPGQQSTSSLELLNLSTNTITIDSVSLTNTSVFSLNKNFTGQIFDLVASDSIEVTFQSDTRGRFVDTISIFSHAIDVVNPIKIAVTATANTPPYLYHPIPQQTAIVGLLFSFQIPDSTFLDDDIGDTLAYQASGLPSWLSFNSSTRTFQGTPSQITSSPLNIYLTAEDSLQANASTTFQLSVIQQVVNTTYGLQAGWNLISVPSLLSDYSADVLFPGKDGDMYSYNSITQGYIATSTLTNGLGYWVHYSVPDTSTIGGLMVGPMTITITKAGWVLLGSHEADLPVSSLVLSNGAIILGDIAYGYTPWSGYIPKTIIKSGEGCWIYVDRACSVTIP